MKIFLKIFIFLTFSITISCGAQGGSVTGGPIDTEKLVIEGVKPNEFSSIKNKDVVFMFSKPLDEKSISGNIFIYPQISKKKIIVNEKSVRIKIREDLEENKNYFFRLKSDIKDYHNLTLDKDYLFVFSVNNLNSNSISGKISFEHKEDQDKPIFLTLFSSDSTNIYTQKLENVKNYEFKDLNMEDYFVEGFIDKNLNLKHDKSTEPFISTYFPAKLITVKNLNFAYIDTVLPKVKSVKVEYSNNLQIDFSEKIKGLKNIKIESVLDTIKDTNDVIIKIIPKKEVGIITIDKDLKEKMELLTEDLKEIKYKLIISELEDLKKNITIYDTTIFTGITKKKSSKPIIIKSKPRIGSSVDILKPIIEIVFDRIILTKDFNAQIKGLEDNKTISLDIIKGNSRVFKMTPSVELNNFSTYILSINCSDLNGNTMEKESITFVTTYREESK